MALETTIKVVFNSGSDAESLILAELDDTLNVNDDGESVSSFAPGDEPYIRFNASSNVRIDEVVSTSGGVLDLGSEPRTLEVEQLFVGRDEEDELTFSVIPDSIDVSYIGNVGSFITEALSFGRVKYIGNAESTPFLMQASVNYTAKIYQLIPPDLDLAEDETYNIHVVFYVTLTG